MSKAFKQYQTLAHDWANGRNLRLTQSQFRGLKKILSHRPGTVEQFEFEDLLADVNDAARHQRITIDEAHSAKGKAWLDTIVKRKKMMNELRSGNLFIHCVTLFERFTFGGFYALETSRYTHLRTLSPIWRIDARDGESIGYCYGSWQSGSGLCVDSIGALQS